MHEAGPFRCPGRGYGVTVHRTLPSCPMCGGTAWRPEDGHPPERPLL